MFRIANLAMAMLAPLILAVPAAAQQQVRVTGTTRADPVLIRDTLQMIAQYAYSAHGCRDIAGVETAVLPESYVPANPAYRIGEGALWRERWSVTLCGTDERFLLTFWPDGSGGTLFGIGAPYPPDAP